MSEILIPTDSVKNDFKSFLEIELNSRIFFSGKFGTGKTYFLQDFFVTHKNDYDLFHLYPINYHISSNDDIIDLIKYDILVELLKKNDAIFETKSINGIKDSALLFFSWVKENYSFNQFLQSTISVGENISSFSPDIVSGLVGKLGKSLKDILEVDKKFQEFKTSYLEGEKGLIEKYTSEIKSKNITETDYISHLLKEKIYLQKGLRKSVLVIDDLDRVDPEHVFRILNVLSAYFEAEHENKFGFDRVIIVADFVNLKGLFQHRYGAKADFPGYMDKFYTICPYFFDNTKSILSTVEEIAKSIRSEEPNLAGAIGDSGYIKLFLVHVFSKVVSGNLINLRQLLKATKYQLTELKKGSYIENSSSGSFQSIYNIAIKVLISCFSEPEAFIEKINQIKSIQTDKHKRMPFEKYIKVMLLSLGINLSDDKLAPTIWKDYSILTGQDNNRLITVDGDRHEALFYDLLIEYVTKRKYLENDAFDYD